eukprot:93931-Rhodomonas_salina.1
MNRRGKSAAAARPRPHPRRCLARAFRRYRGPTGCGGRSEGARGTWPPEASHTTSQTPSPVLNHNCATRRSGVPVRAPDHVRFLRWMSALAAGGHRMLSVSFTLLRLMKNIAICLAFSASCFRFLSSVWLAC